MKHILILFFLLSYTLPFFAQEVEFSFPALPEKEVSAYYFRGGKPDSLIVELDKQGKGSIRLPESYRGYVQAVINKTSVIGYVAGKTPVKIESDDARPETGNVRFPGSTENGFFYRITESKQRNQNQNDWLQAGTELFGKERKALHETLRKELELNEKERESIEKEIETSPLYSARFLEILDFAELLYEAETKRDKNKIEKVRDFYHNQMDWEVLYTAGQFWGSAHVWYLSIFNKENPEETAESKQQRYAADISQLISQLNEPMRSALLDDVFKECDRFGWELAQKELVKYIKTSGISTDTDNERVKRIMSRLEVGHPAPAIEGLDNMKNRILVFYESGCGNCANQLEFISRIYPTLVANSYQVVSLSADTDKSVFEFHSKDYSWSNKFCDFKGFEGDNFTNYGIAATPVIYVTDNEGKILGQYTSIEEWITEI